MTSNLVIRDLPVNQDLDRTAMHNVRGGSNFASVGGQNLSNVGRGLLIAVNAPVVVQNDIHPELNIDVNVSNIFGSRGTRLLQAA